VLRHLAENLGGFWKIAAPLHYNNGTNYDIGQGLVYTDVLRQADTRAAYEYFNVQTTVGMSLLMATFINNTESSSFIIPMHANFQVVPTSGYGNFTFQTQISVEYN